MSFLMIVKVRGIDFLIRIVVVMMVLNLISVVVNLSLLLKFLIVTVIVIVMMMDLIMIMRGGIVVINDSLWNSFVSQNLWCFLILNRSVDQLINFVLLFVFYTFPK